MAAVEAWDAWFRWREDGRLRDVSIDDTWRRIARALAQAEPAGAPAAFERRLADACASWQLLLDEEIIANAGTSPTFAPNGDPVALLNAAAFVRSPASPHARFDHAAFADVAGLAVRALDNALSIGRLDANLRVGLVGVADALAFLGLRYDSPLARAQAQDIARALAEGCLLASAALAAERGRRSEGAFAARDGTLPAFSDELVAAALRHGLRHARTTAITSQPRLALLANNVADALDPLRGAGHLYTIATPETARTIPSSGHAVTFLRGMPAAQAAVLAFDTIAHVPVIAQIELRGAVQPWIDEPIAYPITAARLPDAGERQRNELLASAHRLGELRWRTAAAIG